MSAPAIADQSASATGSEFLVNTTTNLDQRDSAGAGLTNGTFVIVWEDTNGDGSGAQISGQRYAADGTRLGSEFRVNTTTANDQLNPEIAALTGGGFVVV